jgi:hypothetical protein
MANQNQYSDTTPKIRSHGGHVRVTCASNVGQGNGGTSLKCGGCWLQAAVGNTEVVRWNIDAAASATVGQDLARPHINEGAGEFNSSTAQPFFVPIDDVSKLYFYSADADAIIDIIYLQ